MLYNFNKVQDVDRGNIFLSELGNLVVDVVGGLIDQS